MANKAYLVLEDGTVYEGEAFGAQTSAHGEVVFNTSMTGYQEVLTDPSYAGQIVVPTYPLIGNYGVNAQDVESRRIQVAGFVVRQWCDAPSHGLSQATLHEYLASHGVPGISGVDTRAITRRLRSRGVMMGIIATDGAPEEALARLGSLPRYGETDLVARVTTLAPYTWEPAQDPAGLHIVVGDCGLKYNILRSLDRRGCRVTAVPSTYSVEEVLALKPDGIVFSPGPGDPALLEGVVQTARALAEQLPIMGICLGHQVLARAFGARTYKLKFGHRGGNHPVRDLATGRVHITAQNHGYAVDAEALPPELEVSHLNLNDGTVEGLRHRSLPIMTIQYHSEASPGPQDNQYLFDRFLEMVRDA
ncbi:MAG: glutamine-hydrolyzing carbamoyl-phosphate synthase small subunit [Chloroflexi bacterium]|nr:glutamine-hydrolyzing carbamoyl-phosphate synthase small subunit [Chloroflexota bacterium]